MLQGAIFFFWNQYSNIVRKKLSTTALTITVIIEKYTFYDRSINLLPIQVLFINKTVRLIEIVTQSVNKSTDI